MADHEGRPGGQPLNEEPVADTPVSTDGVEIALDEEKDDPAPDSSARVLLTKQARLVDADLVFRNLQCRSESVRLRSERVSLLLRQLTVVVGLCFALGIGAVFVSAIRARGVVVEAFDSPPALAPSGISGQMLAGRIQDSLSDIQERTRTTATRQQIQNAWTNDVKLEVPQTGLSISELSSIMRRSLGKETYLSGSLFLNPDNSFSLVARGTGIPSKAFSGPRSELDGLIIKAAEYLYARFEPRLFAVYLRQAGRMEELEDFVAEAGPRVSAAERSVLAQNLASAFNTTGRVREAEFRARQAVQDDPTNWLAWNTLVSITRKLHGYEAAWGIGREIDRVPGSNEEDAIGARSNYRRIVQDWGGEIDNFEWNRQRAGPAGSLTVSLPTLLADAEAHRHNWGVVAGILRSADPADPSLRATRLYLTGLWLMDQRRLTEAADVMKSFHQLWLSEGSISRQYEFGQCEAAYAMALGGRSAEAFPIFDANKMFPQCRAYAADVVDSRGLTARADQMYRWAIALAPNVPFAYHRWGLSLLRRGDLDRAERMFRLASQRGPRWADPLKGLGDVYAARGDREEARDFYRSASAFAPRWKALQDALSRER